jgi:Zn-dependent peptidase ImmA (M78 family)/transcriptional regulator with XRE-family HTH domain
VVQGAVPQRQSEEASLSWEPGRLKLARELRGLTRAELAVSLGKSAAAVGQYEAAKIQPQRRAWRTLAATLSLPPSFFRLPNAPVLPRVFFRPDRTVPRVAYRRSAAIAGLLGELYSELSSPGSVSRDSPGKIPRVGLSTGSAAEFELVAEGIRSAWDLGNNPVGDLTSLMEQRGIVVASINDNPAPTGSFSTWIGDKPWLFEAASAGLPAQARLDAAHELGHLVMHISPDVGTANAERQAESFALAFLMPRRAFVFPSTRITDAALVDLKRVWGVPMAALVRRGFDLGLISEASYRRSHARLNQALFRAHEPAEPSPERPQTLSTLVEAARQAGMLDDILDAVAWPKSLLHELVD